MMCAWCREANSDVAEWWNKLKAIAAFMSAILRSGCWTPYIVSKLVRRAVVQSHWDVVYIAEAIGRALEERVISATSAPSL